MSLSPTKYNFSDIDAPRAQSPITNLFIFTRSHFFIYNSAIITLLWTTFLLKFLHIRYNNTWLGNNKLSIHNPSPNYAAILIFNQFENFNLLTRVEIFGAASSNVRRLRLIVTIPYPEKIVDILLMEVEYQIATRLGGNRES